MIFGIFVPLPMLHPTITDYIATLENPSGVFRTLGEISVERDIYGAVALRAGNSAAVFRYAAPGAGWRFLKCYVRRNRHLGAVYDYIERRRPALLPDVRLLAGEMFVHTSGGCAEWIDVVEGEWTEGETLAAAVARAVRTRDGGGLTRLSDAFDAMWSSLSAAEWAHGDLKPENIIVKPDGGLALIDCDAVWIPALAGVKAAELGTPPYRDPARTAKDFNKTIDDLPARLISTTLRMLARRPELWSGYTSFEELIMDN
jgi:serine/threonine protein kinase